MHKILPMTLMHHKCHSLIGLNTAFVHITAVHKCLLYPYFVNDMTNYEWHTVYNAKSQTTFMNGMSFTIAYVVQILCTTFVNDNTCAISPFLTYFVRFHQPHQDPTLMLHGRSCNDLEKGKGQWQRKNSQRWNKN